MKIIEAAKKVVEQFDKNPLDCTVDQAEALFRLKEALVVHNTKIEANRARKLEKKNESL